METQQVGFKLGEGFGRLLIDISRDKFYSTLDINKSLEVISSSLGCDKDVALQIFKGDVILEVCEDGYSCEGRPRNDTDDLELINFEKFITIKFQKIRESCKDYIDVIFPNLKKEIKNLQYIDLEISYEEIINLMQGNTKLDLNKYFDSDCFDTIQEMFELIYKSITKIVESYFACKLIYELFKSEFSKDTGYGSIYYYELEAEEAVQIMQQKFNRIILTDNIYEDDILTKYIESIKEIDYISQVGIKPVNIFDNYSAGWLSPNGEYYGLNGEKSNMLHMNIAEMLKEAEIINLDEEHLEDHSIEAHMSNTGWVKIHGDWILYDGYAIANYGYDEIPLTPIQKDLIYRYGQSCCNAILKIGYKQEVISAARFEMSNEEGLRKLFSF